MARTKYLADSGTIHRLVISASRLAVAGTPPAGDIDSRIPAKTSKSNREYGIRPRGVRLMRPVNPTATDKVFRAFLPVLTETAWEAAGFNEEATITIGGVQWKVTARVPEDY